MNEQSSPGTVELILHAIESARSPGIYGTSAAQKLNRALAEKTAKEVLAGISDAAARASGLEEGELVVTQYELCAARTALREIASTGGKITDPNNTYGLQMTNIALAALAGTSLDPAQTGAATEQQVALWMMGHGYATDDADTLDDLLGKLVHQVHANALLEAHNAAQTEAATLPPPTHCDNCGAAFKADDDVFASLNHGVRRTVHLKCPDLAQPALKTAQGE